MRTSGRHRWRNSKDSKGREKNRAGHTARFFLERKTMNTNTKSWLSRNKWILILFGVPVIAGAWWAFRPEKLFIDQRVNEAAPAALSSEPEALYTGRLEGKVHQTSGRANLPFQPARIQRLRL